MGTSSYKVKYEALVDIQSEEGEKEQKGSEGSKPGAQEDRTLREAIERMGKQLEARATALNKKFRASVGRDHWHTRGRQELLCSVVAHLQDLCANYRTTYTLSLALKDYLGCLEKYKEDIEEEKIMPVSSSEQILLQWKAEGAARELPTVFADLMRLLAKHPPLLEQHLLSFDGKSLVPL